MVKKCSILMQVFVLIAFSIIGLMLAPTIIHACSCAESPSANAELKSHSAVFSGRVLAVKEPSRLFNWSSADPVKVRFEVYRVWKGEVGKKVSVQTARASASCGFEFEKNQEYLVFADEDKAQLKVSLCSRTQSFLTSGKDMEALGTALKSPIDDPVAPKSKLYYMLAIGSLVVVVLSFIVILRRRLRS